MIPIDSMRYAAIAILLLLAGCSRRVPQATVEVIDTSLSITPRAERTALDAVEAQIGQMQRGDMLVLIPITGDAANDAGGRILRLTVPTRREAYDSDLHRFQEQAGKQFAAWVAALDKHQSRTDILGALDAAQQEFAVLPSGMNGKLVVVSDFLEDDSVYRFVTADSLSSPAHARELAARLRTQQGFTLQDVSLCLGRLESTDFAPLTAERKEAVRAFWVSYFASGGTSAEIRFDGTGILADAKNGCVEGNR